VNRGFSFSSYISERRKPTISLKGKVIGMSEEMAVFKGYLRSLMRQLKLLQSAIQSKDFELAGKIIDELIQDTQDSIED